jgi:hypothetical protein
MNKLINSEYLFERKYTDEESVQLTVYINYFKETFTIVQSYEESVFFNDSINFIEKYLAYAELVKEALIFIKKELDGR